MLEDDFTYVLRKALRGLGLSPAEVAERAGLTGEDVSSFLGGDFESRSARLLAAALELAPGAYANHPDYHPESVDLPGITRLILPFHDDHVNVWLISKGDIHLVFDTGNDSRSAVEELTKLKVDPTAVFLTHGHPDHIGGMGAFSSPVYGPSIAGAVQLEAGAIMELGELTLNMVDLSGHFNPSLGYLIGGLDRPVLVAGDAIFAGSIGGCDPSYYGSALQHIKTVLSTLEDHTVILPGHGPPTTVGEERLRNPFLAV